MSNLVSNTSSQSSGKNSGSRPNGANIGLILSAPATPSRQTSSPVHSLGVVASRLGTAQLVARLPGASGSIQSGNGLLGANVDGSGRLGLGTGTVVNLGTAQFAASPSRRNGNFASSLGAAPTSDFNSFALD